MFIGFYLPPGIAAGADSLKRAGTLYLLAIGINQYANRDFNLRYPVADAQVFAGELRRRAGSWASSHILRAFLSSIRLRPKRRS